MELSVEQYRELIEHFPDGLVFLYEADDPPRYVLVGGEELENLGMTKADLEGAPVAEDRPPEIRDQIRSHYRRALDGESVTFETDAEGRTYRIHLAPIPGESGDAALGAGVLRDITEQVLYDRELQRQNERLEQFAEVLTHDLRNPLNVAMGQVDLLKRECGSDRTEAIEAIESALDRIEALAEEGLTRPEAQREEAFPFVDFDPVVRAAWRNVATKDAVLRSDVTGAVRVKEGDLRRLFENLFRNSVEHAGTDVTVTVGDLPDGFYVEDDGPGIPVTERDSVFERGYSDPERGTGLGLFIVETVAETHGWTVTLAEGADGGARFEMTGVETR